MDEDLTERVDELTEAFIAFLEVIVEADDLVLVRAAAGEALDALDAVTFEPDIELEIEIQDDAA